MSIDNLKRCEWGPMDPLMQSYHDEEWGVPVHDDKVHFEFLVLEMFQAGLSWMTVLRKREAFRKDFAGFDPKKVAKFGAEDIARLLGDAGIIRNRMKIEAADSLMNALIPILTMMGLQFAALLAGAILTETTFSWPGMGRLLLERIYLRDYPTIQGVIVVYALLVSLISLLVDIVYAFIDPRVKY